MPSVLTPRPCRTPYSSSPKSSPTGPTTWTSVKNEAAREKCTAEPPSMRSRSPKGVFTASNAIDPTTARAITAGETTTPDERHHADIKLTLRYSPRGVSIRVMRLRLLLLTAAIGILAAPSANAATTFDLGPGQHPDVAVDSGGT